MLPPGGTLEIRLVDPTSALAPQVVPPGSLERFSPTFRPADGMLGVLEGDDATGGRRFAVIDPHSGVERSHLDLPFAAVHVDYDNRNRLLFVTADGELFRRTNGTEFVALGTGYVLASWQ